MSDIVERLRAGEWGADVKGADEIERLENEVLAFQIEALRLHQEIKGLRKELLDEKSGNCARPLEQIRQVCADNAGEASNHKMALDFVHQIAIRAIKEQP